MKTIYLMRHGIAVSVGEQGVMDDEDRVLSEEGRERTEEAARGMSLAGCAPERVFSSPLARARETAEIAARVLGVGEVEIVGELASGADPNELAKWLGRLNAKSALLVGHVPDLPELASVLLVGKASAGILMKRASACSILFEKAIQPGRGALEWLIQPGTLRLLARGSA